MTQLYFPLDFPRASRAWQRLRFADRPNQLRTGPTVSPQRLFIRCGRHGVVVPQRHRLDFLVCSRCAQRAGSPVRR